eukprot:6460676-Amphidinium_carterae.1
MTFLGDLSHDPGRRQAKGGFWQQYLRVRHWATKSVALLMPYRSLAYLKKHLVSLNCQDPFMTSAFVAF